MNSLPKIGDAKGSCVCGWLGTVDEAIPDVDGDGSLGCPNCRSVVEFDVPMSDKERADRLEAMIDRMSETIVNKDAELVYLRRKNYELEHDKGLLVARIANLEKMITNKA